MTQYIVDEHGVVQFLRPVALRRSGRRRDRAVMAILADRASYRCPNCGTTLAGRQLLKHLYKHRYSEEEAINLIRESFLSGARAEQGRGSCPPSLARTGVTPSHSGDQTARAPRNSPDGQDSGRQLAHFAREQGKFGSLPKFDDYGDEASPDSP